MAPRLFIVYTHSSNPPWENPGYAPAFHSCCMFVIPPFARGWNLEVDFSDHIKSQPISFNDVD